MSGLTLLPPGLQQAICKPEAGRERLNLDEARQSRWTGGSVVRSRRSTDCGECGDADKLNLLHDASQVARA
jgi:hypothetical protein